MTILRVCAWCDREITESGAPGKKYEPDCTPDLVSHGCCNECRESVDLEIADYRERVRQELKSKREQQLIDSIWLS